jgi:hypothetical protein
VNTIFFKKGRRSRPFNTIAKKTTMGTVKSLTNKITVTTFVTNKPRVVNKFNFVSESLTLKYTISNLEIASMKELIAISKNTKFKAKIKYTKQNRAKTIKRIINNSDINSFFLLLDQLIPYRKND